MTTTTRPQTTTTSGTELLVELVHDAVSVAAEDDTFDSRTATGATLLSLAGLARRAAGALGADAGVPVTSGPGVVVVRELAAAARLLDEAVSRGTGAPDLDGLLASAKGLHARLHDEVARPAR